MTRTATFLNPRHAPFSDRGLDEVVEDLARRLSTASEEGQRLVRERMVLAGLPVADRIAMRYRNRGVETEDLVQVARAALVKAVNRYRPGCGPGFCAFAIPTISGEVKRWFRDHAWTVRPPRRLQELGASITRQENAFRHHEHREPSDTELALALGAKPEEVAAARRSAVAYRATSLDSLSANGWSHAQNLADGGDLAEELAWRDALHRGLRRLSPRDRHVLELRFVSELTQAEIGDRIGVSQMQVSRILARVLGRLREEVVVDRDLGAARQGPAA